MTAQLKLCPFCKAKLSISSSGLASHDNRDRRKCLISSMAFPTEDLAQLNGWNHRPIEQQLIDALESAVEQIKRYGGDGLASGADAALAVARGEA